MYYFSISIGHCDGIAFEELDVALKQVAKEESAEDSMSVEVTLPRKAPRRARSLSRNNTETLPDEVSKKLFLQQCTVEHFWFRKSAKNETGEKNNRQINFPSQNFSIECHCVKEITF